MTEHLDFDDIRAKRADLQRALTAAEVVNAREAYQSTIGQPNKFDEANAEVERLKAAIAHLSAAEVGALEAAQKAAEEKAARELAAHKECADRAAPAAIKAAERIDDLIPEMVDAFTALRDAYFGHHDANAALLGQRANDTSGTWGSTLEPFFRRTAALLARGGVRLPAGDDVMREADIVDGHPEQGLVTVTGAVEDAMVAARRRANRGDDTVARSARKSARREPDRALRPLLQRDARPAVLGTNKLGPAGPFHDNVSASVAGGPNPIESS